MNSLDFDSNRNATSTARMLDHDARLLTAAIPPRWRATILLLATILFFPIFITIVVLDVLTEDMPKVRALLAGTSNAVTSSAQALARLPKMLFRVPQVTRPQPSMSAAEVG